jgi:hypothetical protein
MQRCLELVDELELARADLVTCSEESLWAQLYPSESLMIQPSRAVAGGRREPTEKALPGFKQAVDPDRLLDLLRADAHYQAAAVTPEQQQALGGPGQRDRAAATWDDTDEGRQAENDRRRAARERLQNEWGGVAG